MNKKMKLVLDLLLIIALCLPVLGYLNNAYRKQWDSQEFIIQRKECFQKFDKDSTSVLIMGSSGLYAGVDPNTLWKDYGITSYNLSNSSLYTLQRYHRFKDLITDKKIDLLITDLSALRIVLDTPPSPRIISSYKSTFNFLDTYSEKEDFIDDLIFYHDSAIKKEEFYLPFLYHHSNWFELTDYRQVPVINQYQMGSLYRFDKKEIERKQREPTEFNMTFVKYLHDLIDLALENGTEVMLVYTPRSSFDPALCDFAKKEFEKPGVKVIDYSSDEQFEIMGLDLREDFYDAGHLNFWGNRKFTKQLGKDIIKNYPGVKIWQESDLDYIEKTKPWVEAYEEYENFLTELESNNEE